MLYITFVAVVSVRCCSGVHACCYVVSQVSMLDNCLISRRYCTGCDRDGRVSLGSSDIQSISAVIVCPLPSIICGHLR